MRGDKVEEVDMGIFNTPVEDSFGVLPDVGVIKDLIIYPPQVKVNGTKHQVPSIVAAISASTDTTNNSIEVKRVPNPISVGGEKQKLRVRGRTSGTPGAMNYVNGYQATDGDFAEKKVLEIEESFDPARYPLRVGQIVGSESFGCDILSFDTEIKRDNFKNNKDRNWDQIDRFIEVKGRKHNSAEIELRGNEKNAASKYNEKYFLYRLHKVSDDNYLLSILKNPLADSDAIEQSVYVNLDKSAKKEVYEVSGGE
jgi:hypothetical protein